MKVMVYGAGQVGTTVAMHLCVEGMLVGVIDLDQELPRRVRKSYMRSRSPGMPHRQGRRDGLERWKRTCCEQLLRPIKLTWAGGPGWLPTVWGETAQSSPADCWQTS